MKKCNQCKHFILSCRPSRNNGKYLSCYKCELTGKYAKDYL